MEEDIVKKMLEYRAKNCLSQEEFAKLCKVTKATIWNIETRRRTPTPLTRTKINLVIEADKEQQEKEFEGRKEK